MKSAVFAVAVAALAGLNPAAAATITIAANGPPAWVHVVGRFEAGDDQRFRLATSLLKEAVVVLKSGGGSADAGLGISRSIRTRGFETLALHCASACAVAWLGGVKRWMSNESEIGFHAVYLSGTDRRKWLRQRGARGVSEPTGVVGWTPSNTSPPRGLMA
jgi:hypothetical protein